MGSLEDGRGILFPARLPTFHREPAPTGIEGLVRWFWIPLWDIAPGRVSRQNILPFPASNLVVDAAGVGLSGPTTGPSFRDLSGKGWAVGALLRPAAIASLHRDPGDLQDLEIAIEAPELHRDVCAAMTGVNNAEFRDGDSAERCAMTRIRCAVAAYCAWITREIRQPDEGGQLANAMEDLIASDRSVVRVEQVARHLGVSVRAVQRLSRRHIGLPPLVVIRRYRLQEAAQRLREDPEVTIAQVAADLGYSDHAHLTSDFRRVLGFTPRSYRSSGQ